MCLPSDVVVLLLLVLLLWFVADPIASRVRVVFFADRRLPCRDAAASRLRLSPEMMASSAEDFGFGRDTADLQKLTVRPPES